MPGKVQYSKGPPCPVENCKSLLYYVENGHKYCKKQGHLQEGVQTQQDDDELGTQGRKTRIRRESQETVSKVYRGHTATSLYLQSYQLILWKQCYALKHTVGLDQRLEQLVKNLWALRLQLFKEKAGATSDEDTVFSSLPVSETETERDEEGEAKKWNAQGKKMPMLVETLALLYLGTVLLRLPVSMGDIHRWAVREDIPYIRAVRHVPAVMKQKLPAEYLKALDTTSPLEPDHLRRTIHNLALVYNHHFKLVLPPINASLLLYRYIRDLVLPITLYLPTLSISALLGISFNFPLPSSHQRTSSLPELCLVSLLIVATKIYQPFNDDRIPRHARSLADPAALAVDWAAWFTAQKDKELRLRAESSLPRGSEIEVTEQDVMKMTGEQLDQYMDYYERTFIDTERVETKHRGLPQQLLDMFPTGRLDGSSPVQYDHKEQEDKEQASADETSNRVIGSLKLRPITSEDDGESVPRMGSFYKRYRKIEDLEGHARGFHERVAQMMCIKLETLLVAVGQVERKLIVWQEAKMKEGLGDKIRG